MNFGKSWDREVASHGRVEGRAGGCVAPSTGKESPVGVVLWNGVFCVDEKPPALTWSYDFDFRLFEAEVIFLSMNNIVRHASPDTTCYDLRVNNLPCLEQHGLWSYSSRSERNRQHRKNLEHQLLDICQ